MVLDNASGVRQGDGGAGFRGFSGFSCLLRSAVWPEGDAGPSFLQALLVQSGERRNVHLSEIRCQPGLQRFLAAGTMTWCLDASHLGPQLEHPERCGCWTAATSPTGRSVGVARSTAGDGQGGQLPGRMFLAYVSPGTALVDKGLYLPESWTSAKTGVTAGLSKTQLALEMLRRALERGHLRAGSGQLRDVVIPRGTALGDALRPGRPGGLYGVAAGPRADQCGVSGIRASPQTQVARRSAPDHGAG